MVVVVHDHSAVTRLGAVPGVAFALGAGAARTAGAVADQNVRRLRGIAIDLVALGCAFHARNHAAIHQGCAGAHVVLLKQVQCCNLRAVDAGRGHLGRGRRWVEDARHRKQCRERNVPRRSLIHRLPSLLNQSVSPCGHAVEAAFFFTGGPKYCSSIHTVVLFFMPCNSTFSLAICNVFSICGVTSARPSRPRFTN